MKVWFCELKILPAQQLYFLVVLDELYSPDETLYTREDKIIPLIVGSADEVKIVAERVMGKELEDVEIIEDFSDVHELIERLTLDAAPLSERAFQGLSFLYDSLEQIDEFDTYDLQDGLRHLCIMAIESGITELSVSDRKRAVSNVLEAMARVLMRVELFW